MNKYNISVNLNQDHKIKVCYNYGPVDFLCSFGSQLFCWLPCMLLLTWISFSRCFLRTKDYDASTVQGFCSHFGWLRYVCPCSVAFTFNPPMPSLKTITIRTATQHIIEYVTIKPFIQRNAKDPILTESLDQGAAFKSFVVQDYR